jgi:hypothetical protein
MRLGFLSAPREINDAVDLITANSMLQCPSFTQAVLLKLLDFWGIPGLIDHCGKYVRSSLYPFRAHTNAGLPRVSAFYRTKRDMFVRAAEKHLTGVAEWVSFSSQFQVVSLPPHLTESFPPPLLCIRIGITRRWHVPFPTTKLGQRRRRRQLRAHPFTCRRERCPRTSWRRTSPPPQLFSPFLCSLFMFRLFRHSCLRADVPRT